MGRDEFMYIALKSGEVGGGDESGAISIVEGKQAEEFRGNSRNINFILE